MDQRTFDRIVRVFGGSSSRRAGLRAALGALVSGVAAPASAARRRGEAARTATTATDPRSVATGAGPWPAGPCGPTGKDNACTKSAQCCTGYCKKGKKGKTGRCRCVKVGRKCVTGQTCCGGASCTNGKCTRSRPGPTCTASGGACSGETCCPGLTCASGTCGCTPSGNACSSETCCAGLTCRGGTCACTPAGEACASQTCCTGQTCWNGSCQTPTKEVGQACTVGVDICNGGSICRVLLPDAQSFTLPGTYCSLDTGLACTPAGAPISTTSCVGGWCSPTSLTTGVCGIIDQVSACSAATDTCAGITGFGMVEFGIPPVGYICVLSVDGRPCRLSQNATYISAATCASDADCTTAGHPACVDIPASGTQCSYVGFTGIGSYCRDAQITCASAGDCPAKPSLTPSCNAGYCSWA
ncbi:MAG: hypothetical protein ACKOWF_16470 [Chloroflexota bacterium]